MGTGWWIVPNGFLAVRETVADHRSGPSQTEVGIFIDKPNIYLILIIYYTQFK